MEDFDLNINDIPEDLRTNSLIKMQALHDAGVYDVNSYIEYVKNSNSYNSYNDTDKKIFLNRQIDAYQNVMNRYNEDMIRLKNLSNSPEDLQNYSSISNLKKGEFVDKQQYFTNDVQKEMIKQNSSFGNQFLNRVNSFFVENTSILNVPKVINEIFSSDGFKKLHNGAYDETRIYKNYTEFFRTKDDEGNFGNAENRTINVGSTIYDRIKNTIRQENNEILISNVKFNDATRDITIPNDKKTYLEFCKIYSSAFGSFMPGTFRDTADVDIFGDERNKNEKFDIKYNLHTNLLNTANRYNDAMSLSKEYNSNENNYNLNIPITAITDPRHSNTYNLEFANIIKRQTGKDVINFNDKETKNKLLNIGENEVIIKAPQVDSKDGVDTQYLKLDVNEASVRYRMAKAALLNNESDVNIDIAYDNKDVGYIMSYSYLDKDKNIKKYDRLFIIPNKNEKDEVLELLRNNNAMKAYQTVLTLNAETNRYNNSRYIYMGDTKFNIVPKGNDNYLINYEGLEKEIDGNTLTRLLTYRNSYKNSNDKYLNSLKYSIILNKENPEEYINGINEKESADYANFTSSFNQTLMDIFGTNYEDLVKIQSINNKLSNYYFK